MKGLPPNWRLELTGATTKQGIHSICVPARDGNPSRLSVRRRVSRPQLKRGSLGCNPMNPLALLVAGLLLSMSPIAAGQRLRDDPWVQFGSSRTAQVRSRSSCWLEGATIGAAVVGTTGAWVAYELGCHFSDVRSDCKARRVLAGGVFGGVLGGIAGGLVGGAFSAPNPRPLRGHPVRTTLIGAAAGALWSFGLFWHFCTDGCRSEEVIFGVSSTGTGALAGYLIGR